MWYIIIVNKSFGDNYSTLINFPVNLRQLFVFQVLGH